MVAESGDILRELLALRGLMNLHAATNNLNAEKITRKLNERTSQHILALQDAQDQDLEEIVRLQKEVDKLRKDNQKHVTKTQTLSAALEKKDAEVKKKDAEMETVRKLLEEVKAAVSEFVQSRKGLEKSVAVRRLTLVRASAKKEDGPRPLKRAPDATRGSSPLRRLRIRRG